MKPERHVGYIYFAALRLDELISDSSWAVGPGYYVSRLRRLNIA